jgi:hypothetical protein
MMVIMCVPVEELLCQTAMGQIPVLKYLLSGVRWRLCPCPIVPGIKCHHLLRTGSSGAYPVPKSLGHGC